MERVGLRLQLRRVQAEAGDVVLLYGDESEALTHPYLAHAWAERGADLRVQAPGQARKVAILGVLDAIACMALVGVGALHGRRARQPRSRFAYAVAGW